MPALKAHSSPAACCYQWVVALWALGLRSLYSRGARIKDTNQGKTDKIKKKIQGLVFTVHPPWSLCAVLSVLSRAVKEPGTIIAQSSLEAPKPSCANSADRAS